MKKVLIMEGNSLARQKDAERLGVRSASAIYSSAVSEHFPDLILDVIHAADKGQSPPKGAAIEDYDALIVGGSALHAYDKDFAVQNQIDLLRQFGETGKPVLGSCWGLQIAAIAAGGDVKKCAKGREVGIARKIRLNPKGANHPFFAGKPEVFDAPCIHYDEVTSLPSGSTLLCSNEHSEVQGAIIPVGRSEVWAVQYHPEFDVKHLADLYRLYSDDMINQGFFEDDLNATAYTENLLRLHDFPTSTALSWQLGIESDITNATLRRAEIINWVNYCVLDQPASGLSNHT